MENKNRFEQRSFRPPEDITKKEKKISFAKIKKTLLAKPSKKRLLIILSICTALVFATVAYLLFFSPKPAEPSPLPEVVSNYTPPAPKTKTSPLTGVQVEPALAERAVTGIMIENSIDARPQAGLTDAGVVFEAIAEGGITRFLALFQESQPDYIGPIRSARPYYVRWATGFDAAYVHSGGSPEALELISSLGTKDMDHARNDDFFTRVSNRYAPHNVYTSMARLDELRASKGFTKSDFTGFARIQENEDEEETKDTSIATATAIDFDISGPQYNTSYNYDTESKTYKRFLADQNHVDERSGKQIAPRVVVALMTDYAIHPDGVHSTYKVVGDGKILVFQDGKVYEGKWQKDSESASLKFMTNNGEDLELEPGQTWITAIEEGGVSYTP